MFSEKELVKRADMALADLTTAGLMNPEQSNRFIRKLVDQPTILNRTRVVRMRSPAMEINKIGFGARILRAAKNGSTQNGGPYGIGSRALAAADRAKPTTSKLTISTNEFIAEVWIPYEVLEDSIEASLIQNPSATNEDLGTQFEATVLDLMSRQIARDLEELLITGDTGSGDAYLASQNGILNLSVSNIVNFNSAEVDPTLFSNMIKALPTKYRRLLGDMTFFVGSNREIDYRMQIAKRQTGLGDAVLTGTQPMAVLGVRMQGAALMPNDKAILTDPTNIIWGVHRDIRLEYDRDVSERVIKIVVSMRVGFDFEEEEMVVKAINIGG